MKLICNDFKLAWITLSNLWISDDNNNIYCLRLIIANYEIISSDRWHCLNTQITQNESNFLKINVYLLQSGGGHLSPDDVIIEVFNIVLDLINISRHAYILGESLLRQWDSAARSLRYSVTVRSLRRGRNCAWMDGVPVCAVNGVGI